MRSLTVNALLNATKQVFSILFPLITVPYITRVLGIDNYGKIAFSSALIGYFALLAGLGIQTYAVRNGASIRDNSKQITEFASELFTINILSTLFSIFLLALCILCFPELRSYSELLGIMSVGILCTTLGCDWVNSIFEDFLSLTIRTVVIQFVSLALMFLLVRQESDYVKYASIGVFAGGMGYILNAFYIRKYVCIHLCLMTWSTIKKHLVAMGIFFFNQVAIMLYVNSDMIMLGIMRGDADTGLYSLAVKIYSVLNGVIYAILLVLVPHCAHMIRSNADLPIAKPFLDKIFNFILLLVIPVMVGLAVLSKPIVQLLGGQEFNGASEILSILSIAMFCSVFAGLYSASIMLPVHREKTGLYITIACALVNVVLNFGLIPYYGPIAAACTTVIAEAVGMILYWCFARKMVRISITRHTMLSAGIGTIWIIAICVAIQELCSIAIVQIILSFIIGAVGYLLSIFLFNRQFLLEIVSDTIKIHRGR